MIHDKAFTFGQPAYPYDESDPVGRIVNRINEIRERRNLDADRRVLAIPVLDYVDEHGKKTRLVTNVKGAVFKEPDFD